MLRVPQLDQAMVYTLLALALWAGQFRSWYLITVTGILALRPQRATPILLSLATALSLILYPVAVWAHMDSGLSLWQAHAFLTFFLIVPTIACLAREAWFPSRRRPRREGQRARTAEQDLDML
jgi:hypothetical protein